MKNKRGITFSYIKNGATEKSAEILHQITEFGGFEILAMKPFQFNEAHAKQFYEELKEKPFFLSLWQFTVETPVLAMILTHPTSQDVIGDFRKLIGSTDPNKAETGTVRELYGNKKAYKNGIPANAIHGSDSHESAIREIKLIGFEFDLTEYE